MKRLKLIIGMVLGLLLLLVVALGIFVATFDANQYKPEIIAQVKKATGRDLNINGNIALSLFPWLGLQLNQLTLSNARGFDAKYFASLKQADVKVEILPLLKAKLSIDRIRLHGLQLNLQRKADGSTNWDDLTKPSSGTATTRPQPQAAPAAEEPGMALAGLLINGVDIQNAEVNWQDDQAPLTLKLEKFNLETGTIGFDKDIPVSTSAHLALSQPKAVLDLSLKTRLQFDQAFRQIRLSAIHLKLDSRTPDLPADHVTLDLTGNLKAQLQAQQFELDNLVLNAKLDGKELPNQSLAVTLSAAARADLKRQTAELREGKLSALGLTLNTSASVSQLSTDPQVSGQLQLAPFNPSLLPSQLGISLPAMQDPRALSKAQLSLEYQASPKAARLEKIRLLLDDSTLSGHVAITDLARQSVRFQLNLDHIDLDHYLPPGAAEAPAPVPAVAAAPEDIPIPLPVALIKSLDVDGQLAIGQVKVKDIHISDIRLPLKAQGGVVTLKPVSLKTLEGHVEAALRLDVNPVKPAYALDLQMKQLQAAPVANPLLKTLTPKRPISMEGSLDAAVHVQAQGTSVNTLVAASNGKLNFNVDKAQLKNLDLEFSVKEQVVKYLQEKKAPVPDGWPGTFKPEQQTAFKVIRASAVINNGVVSNRDLLLDSARIRVTGSGTADLNKRDLNYRPVVDIQPGRDKTLGDKLVDIPMAIKVSGPFTALKIEPDLHDWKTRAGNVLKAEAKQKVREAVKKETRKAENKAKAKIDQKLEKEKQKLRDKLKGLFK